MQNILLLCYYWAIFKLKFFNIFLKIISSFNFTKAIAFVILQFDPELSLLVKTPTPVSCQEDLKNIMSHFEIQIFLCP